MSEDPRENPDNAGVVAPPPLIYAGALSVGLPANGAYPVPFLRRGVARLFGWSLLACGMLLGGWFQRTLRRAGTPVSPERPVTSLVTGGPYRYTRNPGYLPLATIHLGLTVLANALPSALLLPFVLIVMRRGVIEREERYREREFGEEYLRYKARVRRWI